MMRNIQIGARFILGLSYFVFGGMGLAMVLGLMHMPEQPMTPAAGEFMKGIMATGYFLPVLKLTETLFGLLLLLGIAAPLSLVVLAPVTLQIILFNTFLTAGAGNLIVPLVMLIAHIIAMAGYWDLYKPLFSKGK